MRFEKIVLKNYRQFKNVEISFDRKSANDLHVFIGLMGTGKTNLLNAICWCLYGNEPYLSKDSQQLPRVNLKAIENAKPGEDIEVYAEVWTETEARNYYIYKRRETYRVYKEHEKRNVYPQSEDFEVEYIDEEGNMKIFGDVKEELRSYVERFLPESIREFFFFDGERLDRYFKEATAENVRNAIFKISQLDVLDTIGERIDKILSEIRKEAGKMNPKIEETRERLEQKKSALNEIERRINECREQISKAKTKIKELQEEIARLPDVDYLETERARLKSKYKEKMSFLNEKIREKRRLLVDYSKIILLWPAIEKTLKIIKDKRKNREIPPNIDKNMLEDILKKEICSVCGRRLDEYSKRHVEQLVKEVKITSETARELLQTENLLGQFKDRVKMFEEKNVELTREITQYEQDLAEISRKISEIDKKLLGYDVQKIKNLHQSLRDWEQIYEMNEQRLGMLRKEKEQLEKEYNELNEQLDKELKMEKKAEKLKMQIDFCRETLDALRTIKDTIMTQTREEIQKKTREIFFNLIWKRATFNDVTIRSDYSIGLIHQMGYDCLGTISGGERETLTLAFTLALHEVSGFNCPIVVDRPLAMVSGPPRRNIVDVFSKVSRNKQIILFFTPDDYSPDIGEILDRTASNKFSLNMSEDEKETNIEVL